MKNEILENIKNNTIFDFIYSNIYKLSTEETKRILLEYIYILDKSLNQTQEISATRAEQLKTELIENIKEYMD